jgi:hypothetical protein
MHWTGPPRNGEPQTGQSLGQKTTPNASPVSYPLHAESTLRRYARLGFGISLASWRYFTAHAAAGPFSIQTVHIFESSWDMLAVSDKLSLHSTPSFAGFCTRGTGNVQLVASIPATISDFRI